MKHTEWQPKRRIEANYQQALNNLMNNFFKKLPHIGGSDPMEIMREFRVYCQNGNFSAYVRAAASRMVTGLAVENARTWRQAAQEGMQSKNVHRALQKELQGPIGQRVRQLVESNAELIGSLPDDIAQSVNRAILQESMRGRRAAQTEEIVQALSYRPDIEQIRARFVHLTQTRIALISRTETSKASTALTRARSEELELPFYVWRTSKDGRVRTSHRHMDGVIIPWSEAPSPEKLKGVKSTLGAYHAGDSPNCRCYPAPIVSLNVIKWPARVYQGGSIQYMTRSHFERMYSIRKSA